jgi:hypothetical protein
MTVSTKVELWTDWECAGGTAVGQLLVLDGTFSEALDNTDGITLSVLNDDRVTIALRQVLRVTDANGTVREYRVQSRGNNLSDARRSIKGLNVLADLATLGLVRTVSGSTTYAVGGIGTASSLISTYVLANLAADGATWLGLGTIESTVFFTLTAPASGWTRLEWLRAIANATGTELRLRRNGASGYLVDLLASVGSTAATVPLAFGKQLLDVQDDDDDGDLATAVTVLGATASGATTPYGIGENAWTIGTISGAGPYWVPLADPAGGAAPIAFASQFGTATGSQAAYLLTKTGTTVQVTDSRITPDYAVSVAATAGLTAGDLVQLVADSSATRLAELRAPNVSRLHRVDTVSTLRGERNLALNGAFTTWTTTTTPASWYVGTSQTVAEYPRATATTETAMVCDGAVSSGATSFTFRGVSPGARYYRGEALSVGGGVQYVGDNIVIADGTGRGAINFLSSTALAATDGQAVTWYLTTTGTTNFPWRPASFPSETTTTGVARFLKNGSLTMPADPLFGIATDVYRVKYVPGSLSTVRCAAGLTIGVGNTTISTSSWLPQLELKSGTTNTTTGTLLASATISSTLSAYSTTHLTLSASAVIASDTTIYARVTPGYVVDIGTWRESWQGLRWLSLWLGDATDVTALSDAPTANQLWQRGNRALAARALASQQLRVSLKDLSVAAGYVITREQLTLGGRVELVDLGLTVRVVAITYSALDASNVQVLLDSRPTRLIKFLAERV